MKKPPLDFDFIYKELSIIPGLIAYCQSSCIAAKEKGFAVDSIIFSVQMKNYQDYQYHLKQLLKKDKMKGQEE